MVTLRPFSPSDWQVIAKYQHTDMTRSDAVKLIDQFNAPTYQGKFHRLLAVERQGQIVGYVSVIEQTDGIVSVGVEIYAPFRQQGCAYEGLTQLFALARSFGYHTATGQVRKDNAASLALCGKLGFSIVGEAISRRGNPVYNLAKSI